MAVAGGIRTDGWAFAFILGISPCLEWVVWAQCTRLRAGIPAPGRALPRPVAGPVFVGISPAGARPVQAALPGRSTPPALSRRKSLVDRQASFATDPAKSVPPVLIAGPGLSAIWVLHPAPAQSARTPVSACGSGWPESRSGASGCRGVSRVTGHCFRRSAGPSA